MQKSLIALLLLGSASVFANEAGDEQFNRMAFAGTASRAEVTAGVSRAQAAGTLRLDEYQAGQQQAGNSGRSRADLRSEAIQAARSHAIHELY